MKNQLSKKLSAFIVPIAIGMMFSASANAQIVYTDINPDISKTRSYVFSTVVTTEESIDVNNDGIFDFKFILSAKRTRPFIWGPNPVGGTGITIPAPSNGSVTVSPLNGSAIISSSSGYPLKMNLNDVVNSSANWSSTANQILISRSNYQPTQLGNWTTTTDGFLGLRIISGSQTNFCWVRLNVAAFTSGTTAATLTLKDYAYNTIPNQPIRAGETSCTTPTVNLTQSGSLSFCNGDSVTLTANGTGYQYQWKKNNVNIAGATAQTYVAKTAGTYTCTVTNSCGSVTSSGNTVTVPCLYTNTNINTTASYLRMTRNELEHLSVYPNPATNAVTIKFPSDEAGKMQVVNLFGQIVYSEEVNAEQTQIDVSRFVAGMYVIRWSSGENFETKTFSVTK